MCSEIRAIQGQPAAAVAQNFRFLIDQIREHMPPLCCSGFPTCDCAASPEAAAHPLPIDVPPGVNDALFETGCLCFENAVHNPTAFQKLLAAHTDDGKQPADWAAVVVSLVTYWILLKL